MPTISTHIDAEIAHRISETARLEDRKPSQITAAALRWYLRLPSSARDALRRIEASGDKAAEEAAWALGRWLLDSEFDRLSAQLGGSILCDMSKDATEDQIMTSVTQAVRKD
ncbi:hypothetical protein P7B02_02450 [Caulobacter segnis]|uniref:hypothetical protein n=1 Tax=Caulobacter segnis TaxID=88688 RepID=UPI0024108051|nr:hypothetical protein [Caulobacter segnis]MDG2520388.1 hypothetical protein [Caulobacter segnis]